MSTVSFPKSIVVVGGGLAGIATCGGLRRRGYNGQVVLINGESQLPYDRPPLSKRVLTDGLVAADVALHPEQWFVDNAIELISGRKVVDIHPSDLDLVLSDGQSIRPDRIVLATGARAIVPAGVDVGGPIHVLRDFPDAERFRQALQPGARIAIIGAGLIGAEVASSAVHLGCEVSIVAPFTPLEPAVGQAFADALHDEHRQNGVRSIVASVTGIERAGDSAKCLLDNGETLEADAVLIGIGARPDLLLALKAGIRTDHGILVDPEGRTSNPFIFAVGDAAQALNDGGVPGPWRGHWDEATRSGEAVSAALLGEPTPAQTLPWFWSDRYKTHLEVVGNMSQATTLITRGVPGSSGSAAFGLNNGQCVAAVSINSPNVVRAARRLIERSVPVSASDLADPTIDMRKLMTAA